MFAAMLERSFQFVKAPGSCGTTGKLADLVMSIARPKVGGSKFTGGLNPADGGVICVL